MLFLQRDAFFGTPPSPPPPPLPAAQQAAAAAASPSADAAGGAGAVLPPPTRQALLLTTLRFLGVPANNASALSQLRRFQPPPPSYGIAANPIDAELRRELTEYFAPFQEQLRKQLAAHISCFQGAHHTKRKKTKVMSNG